MTPADLDMYLAVLQKRGVVAAELKVDDPRTAAIWHLHVAFGQRPAQPEAKAEPAKPEAPAVAIVPDGEGGLVAEVDPDLFAAV